MDVEVEAPKALSNAERKKRFIDKLKASGQFEAYKKRNAESQRQRRLMVKDIRSELNNSTKQRLLTLHRANGTKNKTIQWRRKIVVLSNPNAQSAYQTTSALIKAVEKAKSALPPTIDKRKEVLMKIFSELTENVQVEIILNKSTIKSVQRNAISSELIAKIRMFYERDDISRMSPNMKDGRKYWDPATGRKEIKQTRHLIYRLSETYYLFIAEVVDASTEPVPIKLAKFCSLRPKHVHLVNSMPHNMCYCLYHTNYIECTSAFHANVPEFPSYSEELSRFLICDVTKEECWLRTCTGCTKLAIKSKVESIIQRTNELPATVKWVVWKKDSSGKRYCKSSVSGTIAELLNYFLQIVDKFLVHSFIKRLQANFFETERRKFDSHASGDCAQLQVDYAENFTCVAQDEIQSAHWNQKTVTVFTISLKLPQGTHRACAFASDNNDHSKWTIVPFLWIVIRRLPKNVKHLSIWSDGPSAQFKNKYIAAAIELFESLLPISITWNFFATSHGKGCVDGIGAIVKNRVRRMIISRRAVVNSASDFVSAFNLENSAIEVVEVNNSEIDEIVAELELQFVFAEAVAIPNISSFHQLMVANGKVIGYPTSKSQFDKN